MAKTDDFRDRVKDALNGMGPETLASVTLDDSAKKGAKGKETPVANDDDKPKRKRKIASGEEGAAGEEVPVGTQSEIPGAEKPKITTIENRGRK